MPTVNRLQVPDLNLDIQERNGKLVVSLDLPKGWGSLDQIPFYEATRSNGSQLLNAARQSMLEKLSQSGLQVTEMQVDNNGRVGIGANAQVPKLGKLSFEIKANDTSTRVYKNNPDVAGAIRAAEDTFDRKRGEVYENRAREWSCNGARVPHNGKVYTVTPQAAAEFYNDKRWFPWEKIRPGEGAGCGVGGRRASALEDADHPYGRQFAQALSQVDVLDGRVAGSRNDAAARLVQAGVDAGFRRDGDLQVVVGTRDNVFAVQGEGPAARRASVALADIQPGAYQRVSEALAAVPAQAQADASQLEPPQVRRA